VKENEFKFLPSALTPLPAPVSQNPVPPANDNRRRRHHRASPRPALRRGLAAVSVLRGRSPPASRLAGALFTAECSPLGAFVQQRGPGCEAASGDGRPMRGQSMTSLAAATHRRARRCITVSPRLRQTEPDRLLVVFPLFTGKKKAWEKSRDPRPSLRTAGYCLHGNEGNKTTQHTRGSLPPASRGAGKRGVRSEGSPRSACCGSWEGRVASTLPSPLLFVATSLQLTWGVRIRAVTQQPHLFQNIYCNAQCVLVILVFCPTRKFKMGTHAQLVFVFASS